MITTADTPFIPCPNDCGSPEPQIPRVKWASLEWERDRGVCVGGATRSQPGSETGAGGWGQRCDSAGLARKGGPAGLTGPGRQGAARALPGQSRPGGDGKGGRPGADEPGLGAGSGRGAARLRGAQRPPTRMGAGPPGRPQPPEPR